MSKRYTPGKVFEHQHEDDDESHDEHGEDAERGAAVPNLESIRAALGSIQEQQRQNSGVLKEIKLALDGDNKDAPGLKTRVVLIEKSLANYAKFLWLVAGAVVTLVIKTFIKA